MLTCNGNPCEGKANYRMILVGALDGKLHALDHTCECILLLIALLRASATVTLLISTWCATLFRVLTLIIKSVICYCDADVAVI